jgi:hypothetical protein
VEGWRRDISNSRGLFNPSVCRHRRAELYSRATISGMLPSPLANSSKGPRDIRAAPCIYIRNPSGVRGQPRAPPSWASERLRYTMMAGAVNSAGLRGRRPSGEPRRRLFAARSRCECRGGSAAFRPDFSSREPIARQSPEGVERRAD